MFERIEINPKSLEVTTNQRYSYPGLYYFGNVGRRNERSRNFEGMPELEKEEIKEAIKYALYFNNLNLPVSRLRKGDIYDAFYR